MNIVTHKIQNKMIAEIISDDVILRTTQNGLDILGNLYYDGFDIIIIHEMNISSEFFDLSTKIAGDILQKFAQYQMPLVIIGEFSKYNSSSLRDFIFESNRGKQVNFVGSLEEALRGASK